MPTSGGWSGSARRSGVVRRRRVGGERPRNRSTASTGGGNAKSSGKPSSRLRWFRRRWMTTSGKPWSPRRRECLLTPSRFRSMRRQPTWERVRWGGNGPESTSCQKCKPPGQGADAVRGFCASDSKESLFTCAAWTARRGERAWMPASRRPIPMPGKGICCGDGRTARPSMA